MFGAACRKSVQGDGIAAILAYVRPVQDIKTSLGCSGLSKMQMAIRLLEACMVVASTAAQTST